MIFVDQPPLDEAAYICVRALRDLNTCRVNGFSVGAIPFTAFVVWAEAFDLDGELALVVWDVLRLRDVDRAITEHDKQAMNNMRGGK